MFSPKYDGTGSRRGYCRQCEVKKLSARQRQRKETDPEYRACLSRRWREQFEKRRERIYERRRERRRSDVEFRLRNKVRYQLYKHLKGGKGGQRASDLLGYTSVELRAHLERQFSKRMSWKNYGSYWHIDHIVPVSAFTFRLESGEIDCDAVRRCWALTNLRPLPSRENIAKGGSRLHLI